MTDHVGSNHLADSVGNIRKLMREAEAVSDEALIAFSRLKAAMVQARQNPEIPVDTGQRALMRLTEAERQALTMSTNLLRVHDELSRIGKVYAGPDDGVMTEIPASAIETNLPVMETVFT